MPTSGLDRESLEIALESIQDFAKQHLTPEVLLDFDARGLRISLFRWKPDDGEAAIDALEPFHVQDFPLPSA